MKTARIESGAVVGTGKCYAPGQCCFCGAVHRPGEMPGYGGEKSCHVCGKGGQGEPDEPEMFYKRAGGCL